MMKHIVVLLILLVCVALTHAAFTSEELFARAAVEADSSSSVTAEDVLTSQDFSEEEYQALQQLTEEEFWNELDSQLKQHSLIEKDGAKKAAPKKAAPKKAAPKKAAPKKAAPKKAAPKKAAPKKAAKKEPSTNTNPSGITDKDLEVAAASGLSPFDNKKPPMNATLFKDDDPYEFVYHHHVIPTPKDSDAVLSVVAKNVKKLKKSLINDGKLIYNEVFRLHRRLVKFLEDEDWNKVKITRRKLRVFAQQFKNWKLRKNAFDALQKSATTIVDWETAAIAAQQALQVDYVKQQDEATKQIRSAMEDHSKKVEVKQMNEIKARGLKALKKDLTSLKGKAMENFVLRYRDVLYKEFGKRNVDAAVEKGGLKELRKLTAGKAGKILLDVAAHLPTVGPYIRAGVVSEVSATSAYDFVPRWRN